MKKYFTVLFVLISIVSQGQQDTAVKYTRHAPYERHELTVGIALGFIDAYRHSYSLPSGFEKGNTSGFAPIYAKVEYGVSRDVSIAALFGYDAFQYNYGQEYTGNNGPFTRYVNNNTRVLSAGLVAFYHLGKVIPVKHLDPYVGIGLSLNNIRYGAQPQGDSIVVLYNHTVTPYLKAGARYYISSVYSVFADAGYDQHTIFDVGFSCRFFRKDSK